MAGRIPESFIQDLLARTDLVELIESRVPLKRAGSNYTARCPFHQEKTPSFSVSRTKQFYYCFGCGARGTAISFLMDYERLSFPEAIELLAEMKGLEVPREAGSEAGEKSPLNLGPIYDALERASRFYRHQLRAHPESQRAVDYLRERGLQGGSAQRFQLGYAPDSARNLPTQEGAELLQAAGLLRVKPGDSPRDWFRNRIIFPIRDRRGRTIGFGGRVLGEGTPKYLNSPETAVFLKHREVYGLFELLEAVRKPEFILVVEGYLDVIALAQAGIVNTVATLGTATSADHVALLFRFAPVLVFCFDGDSAGHRAAWKALESSLSHLREGREIRFLELPDGEDPDSLIRMEGVETFRSRIQEAKPFSTFFFGRLAEGLELGSIEGRASLAAKARPHLDRIQPGVYRDMLEERLSQLLRRETVDPLEKGSFQSARKSQRGPRSSREPSAFRTFMALLVQHPRLVDHLDSATLRILIAAHPSAAFLQNLVDVLRVHPEATTAGLLEAFRESKDLGILSRLAVWDTQVVDEAVEGVFLDHLRHLVSDRTRENRLDELIERARNGAINDEERAELRRLTQVSDD